MSDEIRLKERTGPTPVPPAQAEPDAAPMVEAPLPGPPQESTPPPNAPAEMSLVHYLDEPLWRVKGWMQLMGVLFILQGVLVALSLWGIIVCWLPIWLGLTLISAAKNIRAAAEFNDEKRMRLALDKLGLYFKINGVLIIIGLVIGIITVVAVTMGVVGSTAMMSQGMHHMMR